MGSIFKKALGVFVEFEEDQSKPLNAPAHTPSAKSESGKSPVPNVSSSSSLNQQDIEKFEKHFEGLFDKVNLSGPDYYEFFKMMETLEAHIPDEKARIAAVFASLSIQGLTKQKLLETAEHYKAAVLTDRDQFDKASNKKVETELEGRKQHLGSLEKKIFDNSELIKNLTKEITEAQDKIAVLKAEIVQEENKLLSNRGGYTFASNAIFSKVASDIQKIQNSL